MPTVSQYPFKFREQIAKEAIKGELLQVEIAEKHDIPQWMVSKWKKAFIDGTMSQDREPSTEADRQAAFRARRAEREQRMAETQEKARDAFAEVLEYLIVVTMAYEAMAGKHGVDQARNYHSAIARARKAYDELFKNN